LESAGFQRHTLTLSVFWAIIPHTLLERTIHANWDLLLISEPVAVLLELPNPMELLWMSR
jgi:hypothetical protein